MSVAKIAVLYDKSLFAAGIERRLQDAEAFEVVRVSGHGGGFSEAIRELGPDIIILDSTAENSQTMLALAEMLAVDGSSKIVKLGLNHEEIIIYRSERQVLETGDDLVAAIDRLIQERKVGEGGGDRMQGA
jgi:DNA-binding NarL/FixJ family response regulator